VDRVVTRLLYMRNGTCEAYPGNYSAYQAHLAAQATLPPAPTPTKGTAPLREPERRQRPARRRKLSVIEQDISRVEAELATLQTAIAHPHNGTDWQRLTELATQQGAAAARLERLMQEWEEAMAAMEDR
jgi:ATPase subunit of ABC transporter with duplicated ATPase domains